MNIAFDWQGTLDVNPQIMSFAKYLMYLGVNVWIISAMPIGREGEREKQIEMGNVYNFPYKVVYHEKENYHVAAGEAKVACMKLLECTMLIDDNPTVLEVVRKAGFVGLQV